MSTNSTIGFINKDNSVDCVYCHCDGYTSYMFEMLGEFYNNEKLAKKLVSLGDLSAVFPKLEPTTNLHSFDHPEPDVTIAYVRDRGEDWESNKPRHYNSVDEFLHSSDCYKHTYLFDSNINHWTYTNGDSKPKPFGEPPKTTYEMLKKAEPEPSFTTMINNMPDYADEYEYLVVRNCNEDGIWFYGAYHDFTKAVNAASECGNGIVVAKIQ